MARMNVDPRHAPSSTSVIPDDATPGSAPTDDCGERLAWMMRHPPEASPSRIPTGTPRPERLVLDTNVSLDLIVFADPRWDPLRTRIAEGECEAVMDVACRIEFARVLAYPQFDLEPARRVVALQAFDALHRMIPELEWAEDVLASLPQCRDTDDQKFMELSLRAGADALLSKDKALLKLARRNRRKGLFEILSPQAWLERRAAGVPEP